jgi:hypothetical protein
MSARYFVRRESSVLGTLFVVYDGNHGTTVGEPKYFKDEADRLAARLNALDLT